MRKLLTYQCNWRPKRRLCVEILNREPLGDAGDYSATVSNGERAFTLLVYPLAGIVQVVHGAGPNGHYVSIVGLFPQLKTAED